ncbi:MAG: hypothetical protein ACP5E3_14800 [Bacteroidales bacterium]
MADLLEILKYTLPAIVVFLTSFFILKLYLKNEEKKRKFELSMNQKDSILPLRLQAFERLILYLERISPDSLVMRFKNTRLSVVELQNELVNAVRTEFEHNLAQQTYVSIQAWEMIKAARGDTIKLINESAAELKAKDPGLNLSKRILEKAMELQKAPNYAAIQYLKKEVNDLF